MKHKNLIIITALIIFSSAFVSCTRSASGSPVDAIDGDSELPNPVSTQSQLMKDIISGTQTAMVIPLDTTSEAENAEDLGTTDAGITESTPEPEAVEEVVVLPTSTTGPPPEVELDYNTKLCESSACDTSTGQTICCCITDYTKDQNATLQVSNPFFAKGTEIRFLMAPEGEYDLSKYILAGVAEYQPPGDGKNFFLAVINIPDSLRGSDSILIRVNSENPDVYAQNFFTNQ